MWQHFGAVQAERELGLALLAIVTAQRTSR
jgi:hypothetical protein